MISAVRASGAAPISEKTLTTSTIGPVFRAGRAAPAPGRRAVAHVVRRNGELLGVQLHPAARASTSRASTSRSTEFRSTIRKTRSCTSPTFQISRTACGSVQVQRGVGTSSNGTAAYAGSINMETVPLAASPRSANVQLEGGSFGSRRASAEYRERSHAEPIRDVRAGIGAAAPTDIGITRASRASSLFLQRRLLRRPRHREATADHRHDARHDGVSRRRRVTDLDTNRRINPLTPRERDGFGERLAALVVHATR